MKVIRQLLLKTMILGGIGLGELSIRTGLVVVIGGTWQTALGSAEKGTPVAVCSIVIPLKLRILQIKRLL